MALSDADILRFDGPSVWGESDCIRWVEATTGLPEEYGARWYAECPTEAHAWARAKRLHGSYAGAVAAELLAWAYEELPPPAPPEAGDVLVVDSPLHGEVVVVVAPGPTPLVRTAAGVEVAEGGIRRHLRRRTD